MRIFTVVLLVITLSFGHQNIVAQTQAEIEEALGSSSKKKKEKEKKEKVAKEKVAKVETTKASTIESLSFKKNLKTGDELFAKGSFFNASKYYQAGLNQTKKKKKVLYLNHRLADCSFAMRDYEESLKFYSNTRILDKIGKYDLTMLQIANSYKHLALYDTAYVSYKVFLAETENSSKLDIERRRARLEMKGCLFADTMTVSDALYKVKNPGTMVNGPFSDFGPTLLNDDLIFSKIQSDHAIEIADEMKEEYYARLYKSSTSTNGFADAVVIGETLNEVGAYVGNPSFTPDGLTMYFTKCKLTDELGTTCTIYRSSWANDSWSDAEKLGNNINQNGSNNTQPCIAVNSEGNTILYFVSDRISGRGGKDIFYAQLMENNNFDKAKNIGYPINTSYDELSPFYHSPTQTLYFSSKGHIGIGGFDIFQVKQDEDGDWLEPSHMGVPLNTSLDDYDFEINDDETVGYLVSNRVGTTSIRNETCCDDIFAVSMIPSTLYVTGNVYAANKKAKELVNEADVVLISENDLAKFAYEGVSFIFEIPKNQAFTLTAKNQEFERVELDFNSNNLMRNDTLNLDLILSERKFEEDLVIGSIYYEFNLARLRADAPDTLRKVVNFMKAYPNVVVEVGAHTDSKGSDEYNKELSDKRSVAAMNYLISQGIAEERLVSVGYGESQPVAPNTKENGADSEEGRALNRRTEFKLIAPK